jgi:hypothetical protein
MMPLLSVQVQRTPVTAELNDLLITAIHATCGTCGDGCKYRYANGGGPGTFVAIRNTAESGLPSGYRVTCPEGYGEGFSVAEISLKLQ